MHFKESQQECNCWGSCLFDTWGISDEPSVAARFNLPHVVYPWVRYGWLIWYVVLLLWCIRFVQLFKELTQKLIYGLHGQLERRLFTKDIITFFSEKYFYSTNGMFNHEKCICKRKGWKINLKYTKRQISKPKFRFSLKKTPFGLANCKWQNYSIRMIIPFANSHAFNFIPIILIVLATISVFGLIASGGAMSLNKSHELMLTVHRLSTIVFLLSISGFFYTLYHIKR